MSELIIPIRFEYTTRTPVPVSDVARSLVAMEKLLLRTPRLLNALIDGPSILSADVLVDQVLSGSLYEDLVVKFGFGSQENLDRFLLRLRERLGINSMVDGNSNSGRNLVANLALYLILAGGVAGMGYVGSQMGSGPSSVTEIEANNNVIITVISDDLAMEPADVGTILRGAIDGYNKRQLKALAVDAVDAVAPLRSDTAASLLVPNVTGARLSPEAVGEIPESLEPDEPELSLERFDNVDVYIRALDRDKTTTGWAAIIPEVSDQRVRLKISAEADMDLLSSSKLVGDVLVRFRTTPDGGRKPIAYDLLNVQQDNQ